MKKKSKLQFDMDSLKNHLQEIYNQLEELRNRAMRDYNKVVKLSENPNDIIVLENARNNSLKLFDNYFAKKIDLLKLQKDVIISDKKIQNEKNMSDKLDSEEEKLKFQQAYQELRKKEYQSKF